MPPKLKLKVTSAQPAVPKTDGSTNRHVLVEGGASVMCPGHVAEGHVILVNTETATYVGKAD